jgi:hypothetical protein
VLKEEDCNMFCITDGSMLNENVWTGTVVEMPGEEVIEATYTMGQQQEVYDAQLLVIFKVAQH